MRNVILSPEEIGIRIKTSRKKLGIPQNEFAESIGKSVRTLQKYESGEISMPLDVLNTIAMKLNMSIEDLLTELQPGVDIDSFADAFSVVFALGEAKNIKLDIEEVKTKDNRVVLAMYCDPENFNCEDNKIFNDFLKEYVFYKNSKEAGSIPEDIYKAWIKKTLIAADEHPIR